MTISQSRTEFAGLPVVNFDPAVPSPAPPGATAWRLSTEYDATAEDFTALVDGFLAAVDPAEVSALIIGQWGEAYETPAPIELLVGLAPRLTALRALFVGEMTFEECEISWIVQDDMTPLLAAYPELRTLWVRGASGLELRPVRHAALREFAIESGGLPGEVVRAVGECDLPALEWLELWLGTPDYGGDSTVDDLAAILAGDKLPALRRLGPRNAEHADDVAAALATAPVVGRLDTLDLSLGTLSDPGAAALLAGQPLTHLRRLDLHHHYIGEEMAARLVAELPGVEVDLADREEGDEGQRYVAVSE
nr:STM4015 family protein [Micromonospora sp. DSM 115978]